MKTTQHYKKQTKSYISILSLVTLSFTALIPSTAYGQATIAQREAKAKQVAMLYDMAEKAYREGNIEVARDTLRTVLAEHPGHPHAIALLRQIKLNGGQMLLAKKKTQFNAVMLKEVDYKDINLAQALKILNQQIITASEDRVIPNFVISDPKKYLGDERLELQMNNVPAGVVLDHLMKKSGTTAKFGKYSITVTPRPSSHKSKPAADPSE